MAAAHEYPIGCSVFVTPPLDGGVLCVGFPLFAAVAARPPTFGDDAFNGLARKGDVPRGIEDPGDVNEVELQLSLYGDRLEFRFLDEDGMLEDSVVLRCTAE